MDDVMLWSVSFSHLPLCFSSHFCAPTNYVEQQLGHTICFANGKYGLDAIAEMDGGPDPTNPDGSLYEFRNLAYFNAANTTETPACENLQANYLTPELSEFSESDEAQHDQTTPQ